MNEAVQSVEARHELVNIQYALCLTVILTFTFRADAGPPPSVELSIPLELSRIAPVVAALVYFLLDWINWNAQRKQGLATTQVLFATMGGIVLLSFTTLVLYSNQTWRAAVAGGYAVIAALWDIYFQGRRSFDGEESATVGVIVAGVRLVIGLFLLGAACLAIKQRTDAWSEVESVLPLLIILILVLKTVRLFTYSDPVIPPSAEVGQPPNPPIQLRA